jgi:hypothetical protein
MYCVLRTVELAVIINLFFNKPSKNKEVKKETHDPFTDMWKFSTGSEEINYEKYEL